MQCLQPRLKLPVQASDSTERYCIQFNIGFIVRNAYLQQGVVVLDGSKCGGCGLYFRIYTSAYRRSCGITACIQAQ